MKKIIKEWFWVILVLFTLLIIGFLLRINKLTYLPVFVDEAIYVRWAQIMRAESTLRFLPLTDGKQPLYMWSIIPFLKLFNDPLFAARFFSVISGIGTSIGVFVASYILFKSKKVSLLSTFLYLISPFTFFFDRMALVDSLLSLFGIWVFAFSILAAKKLKLDLTMITGFLLGGALLTKSPALFFSILIPTTWILSNWPKKFKEKIFHLIKLIGIFIFCYLIAYGMYNLLRLGPNFNLIGSRNMDYVFPLSHLWTNPRDPFIFFIDKSFEWIGIMGPWPLLILALIGLSASFEKFKKEYLLIFIWFIFPILVQSEFAKVITARYVLFTIPFLVILSASAFLTKKHLIEKISVFFVLFFIFLSVKFNYLLLNDLENAPLPRSERSGYLEEWTSGYGIKEISDLIKEEKLNFPDENIIIGTEGYFGTLPDGLEIYLQNVPKVTIIGIGLNITKVPTELKNAIKAKDKVYLVVNSSRMEIENYEKEGLSLIAAYPKAFRPEGLREYVQFGPRDSLYLFEVIK
ncbi:glycosyltransferase family 39 protein [Patescibacteria group bacterium]|nr:glycosyltransferase family 39 protein [Patescibacteria group bacterium]MBU2036304.1 glycosyltransferase family 39 protein [Patescibacteria group bacterium]